MRKEDLFVGLRVYSDVNIGELAELGSLPVDLRFEGGHDGEDVAGNGRAAALDDGCDVGADLVDPVWLSSETCSQKLKRHLHKARDFVFGFEAGCEGRTQPAKRWA